MREKIPVQELEGRRREGIFLKELVFERLWHVCTLSQTVGVMITPKWWRVFRVSM